MSVRRSPEALRRRSALLCVLAGLSVVPLAEAQEGGEAASIAEAEEVPKVVVVGFQDADPDDCNPKIARYGRCVEEVDFVDLAAAFSDRVADEADMPDPTGLDRVHWRNTAQLYAEIWDDLSYRWDVESDPLADALIAKGATRFPPTKQQWEATDRASTDEDRSVYSMPRSTQWILGDAWIDPRTWRDPRSLTAQQLVTPTDAFFPAVRWEKPDGLIRSDPAVILRGRFASRLAVDGRRHPYDIMDADPESSAPIFEQLYPYARGLTSGPDEDDSEIPLRAFVASEVLKTRDPADAPTQRLINYGGEVGEGGEVLSPGTLLGSSLDAYDRMYDLASEQFEQFYDLIGVQVLRFAREEYTPTHIRVLTAIMAMESPPRLLSGGYLATDDLVAASKGQLDANEESISSFLGFDNGRTFEINFASLPLEIVDKHIQTFDAWQDPTPEFLDTLTRELTRELEFDLRTEFARTLEAEERARSTTRDPAADRSWEQDWRRYHPAGLSSEAIDAWASRWAEPGRAPKIKRYFTRIALDLLVDAIETEEERERIETRILLDHLNYRIIRGFGGADAPNQAPGELEEKSTEEWLDVLSLHGMYPDAISDRPGVVNPLAICTKADRRAALEEPSFRKINVDQLFVGPSWLGDTDGAFEVLWEARRDLPFIMMDDPSKNGPALDALVELPGDRTVYRARWEVWSGWHLLWGVEPLGDTSDPDYRDRIALRTGAICEDTVLASPDLVPTLARAALLDGEFRPTVPIYDVGKTQRPDRERDNDQVKAKVDDTEDVVDDQEQDVDKAIAAVKGDTQAQLEVTERGIREFGRIRFKGKRNERPDAPVDSAAVLYLRDLVMAPLRELVGVKPLVLMAFDHGAPGAREPVWNLKPRTPYFHATRKLDKGKHVRSSAWAFEVEPPDGEEGARVLISPAYMPTELLQTSEYKQVWKRRTTSDWNFGGGLGFMPYRQIHTRCNDPSDENIRAWASTTLECSQPGSPTPDPVEGEGFSFDLFALNTQWLVPDRRFAIEFGPEIRLDMQHAGPSWFYDGDRQTLGTVDAEGEDVGERTAYSWTLRFQAGVLVGVRFAPNPGPIWRRKAKRYPWGAPLPDGSSNLSRVQYGFRTGFLMGPTFDGVEGTVLGEAWVGWSIRGRNGPNASLTPYHPAIIVGPYVRGQLGFPMVAKPENRRQLSHSGAVIVGVRAQFRLTSQPEPPEAPEAPSVEL